MKKILLIIVPAILMMLVFMSCGKLETPTNPGPPTPNMTQIVAAQLTATMTTIYKGSVFEAHLYEQYSACIDAGGNIWVGESDNIIKYNSSLVYQTGWGSYGFSNSQFDDLRGLAADSSGNIYAADMRNNRIQKFSGTGIFLSSFGASGSGNGQLSWPSGVALDSAGNIYVSDTKNSRVQKFTSAGVYVTQWGAYGGNGDYNFYWPYAIAVDQSDNVYVSDGNNLIRKFTSGGTFITKWATDGWCKGMDFDPSWNLVTVSDDRHNVQIYTNTGALILKFGSYGTGDGQFRYPSGVVVDSDGYIYVMDMQARIQKFLP